MPWALSLLVWLCVAPPAEGPVEGPARPPEQQPAEPPPPSIEFAPSDGGIELLPPPPPEEEVGSMPSTFSLPTSEERRAHIGKPPDNGGAFLAGGLWLAGVSTLGTVLFISSGARSPNSTPYIIATGVALDLMAVSMIGVGSARAHALHRWGKRHRVHPLLQGGGLITSGSLSLSLGAALIGWGSSTGYTEYAILGAVALASGPIQLGVGLAARIKHKRGNGYRLLPQGVTFIPRPGGGGTFVASFAF